MDRSLDWYILTVCWGAFILIWVAGGLYNLVWGPKVQRRLISLPVAAFGVLVLLIAAGIGLLTYLNLTVSSPIGFEWMPGVSTPWMSLIGAVLLVPSTGLTLWARFALGTMWSNMAEARIDA